MPDPARAIGGVYTAYIPDDDQAMALGYTDLRIYWGTSEAGSYSLADTQSLVSGQKDYSYNKTDAYASDWAYHTLYGAVPGESPASEPVPIGPPRTTRKQVRQGIGERLRMMTLAAVTTGTDANTVVCSSLIDADGSPSKYANRFARAIGGNVDGETKRVRNVANSGYVPASGTLNFGNDFSATPNASVVLELWRASKDEDPAAIIDEGMQRARRRLWWEETFYLSTDSNITEYAMPAAMLPGSVTRVEWASGTYPQSPAWTPVGFWDLYVDGGPMMSIRRTALGTHAYGQGDVIRITYNRFGDRMDDDADYWNVPLEWAVAECAYDYLQTIRTPKGGKEDVSDATVAKGEVAEELREYRAIYMPRPRVHVRGPL